MAKNTVIEFNLATDKGRNALNELSGKDRSSLYVKSSFDEFLKTLVKSPLRFNSMPVFSSNGITVCEKGRKLYAFGTQPILVSDSHYRSVGDDDLPVGVLITDCEERTDKNGDYRILVLMNVDEDGDMSGVDGPQVNLVRYINGSHMPQVSFACLGQFWNIDAEKVASKIAKGEVKLLSYTPQDTFDFTKEERKDKKKAPKPPKLGYSMILEHRGVPRWHRAGTTLFHDTKQNRCLLFGQDEGTYFGCELPGYAKTIAQAFQLLTPAEVIGKPFFRQGEWFMLEVDEKDIPPLSECVLQIDSSDGDEAVFLPLQDDGGNQHWVYTSDGRAGKDGKFYAHNPKLEHVDHGPLYGTGWFTFYRNRALRSVSQEGVD